MRVAKWGNSLAVRLPAKLVNELGVKEGDEVSIAVKGERAVEIENDSSTREKIFVQLRERSKRSHGLFPADYKFKREDAHEGD